MSAYIASYIKDPSAKLDYSIDWSEWLPTGDAISTATWTVTGATLVSSSTASGIATAWIEGGTEGTDATATCRVTTTAGRIDERTIRIQIRGR